MKYRDSLASKRRHALYFKIGAFLGGAVLVFGVIIYGLFFTSWLKITTVNFEGLSASHQQDFQKYIDDVLGHKFLGIPTGRNILFSKTNSLETFLKDNFPFLEDLSIQKKYLHTLNIVGTERQAVGVWCFATSKGNASPDCRYFDKEGITFGQAVQSSGVLLLNVDDMRINSASASFSNVDQRYLENIQKVVTGLVGQGLKIKDVTIPVGTYTEFDVMTGDGYPIKFSLDSDIDNQLNVFSVFRTQKMADGLMHPLYIDLRFDGRVYFK